MRKFTVLLIILSFIFTDGCVIQKKSTMDKLRAQRNPIDAMRLPEQRAAVKKSAKPGEQKTIEISSEKKEENNPTSGESVDAGLPPEIDFSPLDRIPEHPTVQKVKVAEENTPFRQGPGDRFRQMGIAAVNQTYNLLRIQNGPDDNIPWYLIEDTAGNKVFISSKFSSLEKEVAPPVVVAQNTKEENLVNKYDVQKSNKTDLNKIRNVIDPTPPIPEELKQAKHISLNFEGTELYDVITTFCELLQIDYVIEGNIDGKVTLQTFSQIAVEDLYDILEQILALHNITVVKSGQFYRFLPIADAAKKPLSIHYGNDQDIPANERMIIQIVPLQHISVESMKNIIGPLMTRNASFIEIPETNYLMMIELASNVKRIIKVVEALDIDKLASSDIQLYKLNNSDTELVVGELTEIFTSMGYAKSLGESLTFLSLGRLNSILVVNSFEDIRPNIEFWINKLDQPISEGEVSTFVYYVQNSDAAKLAGLLNGIFESGAPTSDKEKKSLTGKSASKEPTKSKTQSVKEANKKKPTPSTAETKSDEFKVAGGIDRTVEGELTIIPDVDTNALIIRTSPRNYPAILEITKKLDLLPQQVLIEVLIVDLTVDKNTQIGMEWALKREKGNNLFSGGLTPTNGTLGSSIGTITSSFLPGGSLLVQEPGRLIAQLQAFASDSKANVLANPILVTSDNKAANISITDEIPIQSSTITQTGTSQPLTQTTIEFRNVGIKLDIFPKINSDNFVNLKISQEISSQGPFVAGSPSFNVRSVNTEVVLKDNQVLVMGGLMRTTETQSDEGIPFFKDIPYLGALFKNETNTKNKTELMLFITPHIISNEEDSQYVTSQFKKRLGDVKKYDIKS